MSLTAVASAPSAPRCFRKKVDDWEDTDPDFFTIFGYEHVLQRALFRHRRTGEPVIELEGFLFVW